MEYSLDPKEVKKVMDAKLKGLPFDENQFLFYHLNRNYFNVKIIRTLTRVGDGRYKDDSGKVWHEVPPFKNMFHMPKINWAASMMGFTTPYSRKFLRDDNITGVGGEFEIVIRRDGKRIDAFTDADYQETYNFARTANSWSHTLLDMFPHTSHSNYTFKADSGGVHIIEK